MTHVSWKRNLVLATVLMALGSFAIWHEFSHRPKKEEKEEQAKKLFRLKGAQIASIRLVDGPRAFAFNCLDLDQKLCKPGDNAKWELAAPAKFRADDSNVNALVSSLNNLSSTETIDLATETPDKRLQLLREYRLDPEARSSQGARLAEVTLADGTQTVLHLGETHAIGDSIFGARAEGKPPKTDESSVYLVASFFKANFDHDLTYWRNKKLFGLASHQVMGFELQNSKGKVSGERKDGQWTISAGKDPLTGDIENIDNVISATTYLTAKTFVSDRKDDAKAKEALRGAKKIIQLEIRPEPAKRATAPSPSASPAAAKSAAAEPIVLELWEKVEPGGSRAKATGGKTGKGPDPAKTRLLAKVSNLDPLFEIEPSTKDRFDKGLNQLRVTKLITSLDRFSVKKLEASGKGLGAETAVFENSESKWSAASGFQGEVDSAKLQGLLDKLSGNRIRDWVSGKAIPAGESTGTRIALVDEKGVRKRDLAFWRVGSKLYARDHLSKRDEAFEIDSTITDAIPWERSHFAKAAPSPSPKPARAAPPPAAPGKMQDGGR